VMLPPIASTINGGPSPLPLSHPGEGFPALLAATAPLLPFSRMVEGGAERRMRACRFNGRRNGSVSFQTISGGPSSLPFSHLGEGFHAHGPVRAVPRNLPSAGCKLARRRRSPDH